MSRFASCYFCGTALDGSVTEQPVVPDDLATEGGAARSVTLCPDCSRKLDAVMDEVRAAVDAGVDPASDSGAPGGSGTIEAGADDDGIDADVDIDASAEEFFEEASQPDGTGSSEEDAGADDGGRADPRAAEGRQGDTSGSKSDDRTDSGAGAGTSHGGETAADDEAEPAKQTISALENSKVMRMLENREFPVERQSFQVVAANAYGVSPSDVGRVIDMAIDRGLLAERNGDLVRPE